MKTAMKKCAAAGVLMLAGVAGAAGVPGQGTWETTLQARDLNGDTVTDAFYDTALDITWLRDANAWAANLVVGAYSDWRLPTMIDTGSPGCDFSFGGTDCGYNVDTATSEMAHLFHVTLGNKAYYDTSGASAQPGWGLTNTGYFQNLQSDFYWSGLEYAPDSSYAWYFYSNAGSQSLYGKSFALYAVAVRPGDVAAAVPEPGAAALLLIGLGALVAARRRPRV